MSKRVRTGEPDDKSYTSPQPAWCDGSNKDECGRIEAFIGTGSPLLRRLLATMPRNLNECFYNIVHASNFANVPKEDGSYRYLWIGQVDQVKPESYHVIFLVPDHQVPLGDACVIIRQLIGETLNIFMVAPRVSDSSQKKSIQNLKDEFKAAAVYSDTTTVFHEVSPVMPLVSNDMVQAYMLLFVLEYCRHSTLPMYTLLEEIHLGAFDVQRLLYTIYNTSCIGWWGDEETKRGDEETKRDVRMPLIKDGKVELINVKIVGCHLNHTFEPLFDAGYSAAPFGNAASCSPPSAMFKTSEEDVSLIHGETLKTKGEAKAKEYKAMIHYGLDTYLQPYTIKDQPTRGELSTFEGGGQFLQALTVAASLCQWAFATLVYFKHLACAHSVKISRMHLTFTLSEEPEDKYTVNNVDHWYTTVVYALNQGKGKRVFVIIPVKIVCLDECHEQWSHAGTLVIDFATDQYFMYDPHMYDYKEDKWGINELLATEMKPLGLTPMLMSCPIIKAQGLDDLCSSWNLYFMCTLIVNYEQLNRALFTKKDGVPQVYRDIQHVLSYKGLKYFLYYMYTKMPYIFPSCTERYRGSSTIATFLFHIAQHETLQEAEKDMAIPLEEIENEYLIPKVTRKERK